MSAYGVFLGPLTGIMVVSIRQLSMREGRVAHYSQADYHLLRKRQLRLSNLFMPNPASDYWYVREGLPRSSVLNPACD